MFLFARRLLTELKAWIYCLFVRRECFPILQYPKLIFGIPLRLYKFLNLGLCLLFHWPQFVLVFSFLFSALLRCLPLAITFPTIPNQTGLGFQVAVITGIHLGQFARRRILLQTSRMVLATRRAPSDILLRFSWIRCFGMYVDKLAQLLMYPLLVWSVRARVHEATIPFSFLQKGIVCTFNWSALKWNAVWIHTLVPWT